MIIVNVAQFNKQVEQIVEKITTKVLSNFKGQAESHLVGQTMQFRGKKRGSIADPNSIVYTLRQKDKVLTIQPNPVTLEVFKRNALIQQGGILLRDQAPDWFEYHGIEKESVSVRPTGVQGNSIRPPLGNEERKFFGNTYNYLVSNAQRIMSDEW